ncbi:MAG: UvrD-helicase domain-containing protein, partial [Vicinamibacteria bacterium]
NFVIADSFTDSLARLTGDEQKAVKTTAFDLQVNPERPGLSFHRLDRAKDKNFWSVRVSADIRIIVHRTSSSLLLCYVDHHNQAYDWAERRKLETHPKTGAAQIVEIREKIREIVVPVYVTDEQPLPPGPPALDGHSEEELLSYGVPAEWLDDVRAADEDRLLVLMDRLPAEAAEAVLDLATGGMPRVPVAPTEDPFEHPDAQRRFRILENVEELERALEFPWDRWMVFLHPDQRQWVEQDFNGPARVSGSAGTGKTIVALHRVVHLARKHPGARILLATFTETLANALRARLRRLIGNEPRIAERIEVQALDGLALRLHRRLLGPVSLATSADLADALRQARADSEATTLGPRFLRDEWEQVVDAWQVPSL